MSRFRRFGPVAAIALALTLFSAAPASPQVDTSSCGAGDNLCNTTTACVWWIFARICTEKRTYWPVANGGDQQITPD